MAEATTSGAAPSSSPVKPAEQNRPETKFRTIAEYGWRLAFLAVAAAMVYIVTTRWNIWEGGPGWQTTDDAYLQADTTPISSKVAGYLREVPIEDYQRVHAGQVLAEIVDDDYRALVAQASAGVASARAQAQALKAQIELQQANIQAAKAVVSSTTASLDQNGRDLARDRALFKTGSSSKETSEKLSTTREQLTAQLAQNRAQAEAASKQLDVL